MDSLIENSKTEEPKTIDETKDEAKNETKKVERVPGVIYLSQIPSKMNVKLIRDYFSAYGDVNRIFLEPKEKKRKHESRSFTEGWVEFRKKKHAIKVAKLLNNTQIGGKRRNPWYHELWNIKFLKNFLWTHLNERIAYEQELRKQRRRQETNLAKKESTYYIQNAEKSEKLKRKKKNENVLSNNSDNKQNDKVVSDKIETDTLQKNTSPLFDKKIKITGNDSFLLQIFSK